MSREVPVFILLLLVGLLLAGKASAARMQMWGDAAAGFQALRNTDTPVEDPGFSGVTGNLHLYGSWAPGATVYTELHMTETNGVRLNQSYFTLDYLYPNVLATVGRFELDYGQSFYYRSDNAQTQENMFVGNPMVDSHGVQDGVQTTYQGAGYYLRGSLTTGTEEAGFTRGRVFGKTAKFYHKPLDSFSWSFSYYASDQRASVETTSFLVNPADEAYFGLTDGETTTTKVTSPGQGNDLETLQFDFRYQVEQDWSLHTFVGRVEDDSGGRNLLDHANVRLEVETSDYLTLGMQYGEALYKEVVPENPDANTDRARRMQVGLSYDLESETLFKLGYVEQRIDDGVTRALKPPRPINFKGFVSQVNAAF